MDFDKVLVKTEYTALSAGTEKACLTGSANTPDQFQTMLGYSAFGIVMETGKNVKNFKPGDKVLIYHGVHSILTA